MSEIFIRFPKKVGGGVLKPLIWLGKRSIALYIVLILISSLFVDYHRIIRKSKVKLLNDIMPEFSYLIGFQNNEIEFDEGYFKKLLYYYKKVDEFLPEQSDINAMLGYCYFHTGNNKAAIKHYEKAISIYPLNFWFHYNLGVLHYKSGNYKLADKELTKALNMKKNVALKRTVSSQVYWRITYTIVNKEEYTKTNLEMGYQNAFMLLVLSKFKNNDFMGALVVADRAIKNKVGQEDFFYYYLGLIAFNLREYEKSALYLKNSIKINQFRSNAYYYLMQSAKELGKEELAQGLFKKYSDLQFRKDLPPLREERISLMYF